MKTSIVGILLSVLFLQAMGQQDSTLPPWPSTKEVKPSLRASVVRPDSFFTYNYNIGNGSDARQSICDIFVPVDNADVRSSSQETFWEPGVDTIRSLRVLYWGALVESSKIHPGNSARLFSITASGIPSLTVARFHGEMPPDVNDDEPEYDTAGHDLLSNSLQVITVGPVVPISHTNVLVFVDTLNSYVTRSRTYNWITTQSIADKYAGYFNRIKNDLVQFNPKLARTRIDTVLQQVIVDSSSTLTSEAYALIRFNTEYLNTQLQPVSQIKAGIFNSTGGTISVKAKPSVSFSSSDTLKCVEATVRWLTSYNITLGSVSSPTYGFAKDGSVATVGSYSYQKFRTTTSRALSWTSGTEYELFTVPITSPSGVETYRLTNALSGGEWFVDINYLDKTDSTFYQDTANGFAYQNKSSSNRSTWYSGSRHLAMTSTKLHEVYSSGGEIVYRRKSLTGSWEVTQRLSPGNGAIYPHDDPCIQIAHDGSIHVVWERYLSGTTYSLWYDRSTDGGATWATADSIHAIGTVQINSSQAMIVPIITEQSTTQLVVIWGYGTGTTSGLKYITSTNLGQSWGTVQSLTSYSGTSPWCPSVASYPVNNRLILSFMQPTLTDVYSSTYNGTSWGTVTNVSSGVGLSSNKYPSVAFDADQGHFYAAWCGQPSGHTEYVIAFRSGNTSGTWGSPFAQFAIDATGISDYYPSITGWAAGDDAIDIIYHTSNSKVKLLHCASGGSWDSPRLMSSNGQWANTTLQDQRSPNAGGYPIRVWTDLSASPYQVTLQSDGNYSLQMVQRPTSPTFHRRVVIESEAKGSVIWFDLAPLKVVTTAGDTVSLPFAKVSPLKPFDATLTNAWDYLGTDTLTLPSNANSLLLETDITSFAKTDSLGPKYTNIFTSSTYQLDGLTTGKSVSLLASQPGVSGKTVVNVAQQAGRQIKIRMVGSVPAAATEVVAVGVGDVYLTQTP